MTLRLEMNGKHWPSSRANFSRNWPAARANLSFSLFLIWGWFWDFGILSPVPYPKGIGAEARPIGRFTLIDGNQWKVFRPNHIVAARHCFRLIGIACNDFAAKKRTDAELTRGR